MVMGGPAAQHNNFWQLLARPTGAPWRLVTPPGVASNGGLVAAPATADSAVAVFRPSQELAFSPLASTTDGGASWSAGLLDARVAAVPGALAADPGSGHLLALLADGTAEASASGGTHWARLVTQRTLAASEAGRRCGLAGLTAVAFGPTGSPLLAGSCRHRQAGVFALSGGTWQLAGPALPASVGGQTTAVMELAATGNTETVLLSAGSGPKAVLLAAWSAGHRGWRLSAPMGLGGAPIQSVSTGPGGAIGVTLTGRSGLVISGSGAPWQRLPLLPKGTQTLAVGAAGRVDALAAARTIFTDWSLASGSRAWGKSQTLHVPVQYGSSG
jgi:hypothetical protein